MRRLAFSLMMLVLAVSASADVLKLDDGTRIEGKARKEGDQWIVIDAAGHETDVPADRIVSFTLGGGNGSPADRLATLRSSANSLSDLNVIIRHYETFIAKNAGSPEAEQAQTDLVTWQQRLNQNCIKVGHQWLTPAERDALIAAEAENAVKIGQLIDQNQMQDASVLLQQALDLDPRDPSALYLNGLVLASQGQTADARAQFTQVNELSPKHAPTLNNLSVLLCRQQAYPAALLSYTQAMQVDPVRKKILDNVAEALHAVPRDERHLPVIVAAANLFFEQDKQLQKIQAGKGKFRWGSTWVTADQLTQLNAEEQAIQDKLALLQTDYNSTEQEITGDDATIRQDQLAMQQEQQMSYSGNTTIVAPGMVASVSRGTTNVPTYSQAYYDEQAEINRVSAARQTSVAHLNDLNNRANALQSQISVPMYSGIQQLIGPEGTPIRTGFGAGK